MNVIYRIIGWIMMGMIASPVIFVVGVLLWVFIMSAKLPTWDSFCETSKNIGIFLFWLTMLIAWIFAAAYLIDGAPKDI